MKYVLISRSDARVVSWNVLELPGPLPYSITIMLLDKNHVRHLIAVEFVKVVIVDIGVLDIVSAKSQKRCYGKSFACKQYPSYPDPIPYSKKRVQRNLPKS